MGLCLPSGRFGNLAGKGGESPLSIRYLDEYNLKPGARVFVRVDFNLPVSNGKIQDFTRLTRVKETLEYLRKHQARILIASHLNRPGGKWDPQYSMGIVAKALCSFLKVPVVLFPFVSHKKLAQLLQSEREIYFLENVRFDAREEKNEETLAREWAQGLDLYVNDAFSVSHRSHCSVVRMPEVLPAVAGFAFREEYRNLGALRRDSPRPFALIFGGKKASTKIPYLQQLAREVDYILLAGGMANTFLKAKGYEIGGSFYEEKVLTEAKFLLQEYPEKFVLPDDVVVESAGKITAVSVEDVPHDGNIGDIGQKSVAKFTEYLRKVRGIFWVGPLGIFEREEFQKGTRNIVEWLKVEYSGYRAGGGGDTLLFLQKCHALEYFHFVSLGGGSALAFLSGLSLPGLDALGKPSAG
ncbi:MAG: phosphoglycerate kinase [bacterium]